jgi:predicted component of type VI protein secretion system
MEIVLRVKSKADQAVQNVRHPINGRMVIGRGPDSAVPLEAPGISRDHLEVQVEDSTLFLTDLSSNGTWINGARMPQGRKCKVREGDFVEVPGYEIQFTLEGAAASAMRPTLPPANVSKRVELAPTPAAAGRSVMASFSGIELFLLLVAVASAALLTLYLTF